MRFASKGELDYVEENSLLIGYYGGLNFGDELLLEAVQRSTSKRGIEDMTITYSRSAEEFRRYHEDYGYKLIPRKPLDLVGAIIRKKKVVFGGGGFWGFELSNAMLILTMIIFVAQKVMRKDVVLLGVGYYNSASWKSHLSARFIAGSASIIFARDKESYGNFSKYTKKLALSTDLILSIESEELVNGLELKKLRDIEKYCSSPIVFISTRRFGDQSIVENWHKKVQTYITSNADKKVILLLMEPKEVDPIGYTFFSNLEQSYENVLTVVDFCYNPLELAAIFSNFSSNISLIVLQYHVILLGIKYQVDRIEPLSYDNKCEQLLRDHGYNPVDIGAWEA